MKKKPVPVIAVLAAACGFLLYHFWPGRNLVLRGEVEGTVYSQVSEVAGKIVQMNAELGSPVKAGDLIARLDSTDQRYMLEQLRIGLEKRLLLSHEEINRARSDVNAAEANYRSAEASYMQARDDVKPLELMHELGGIARAELEKAKLLETVAAETLEAAGSRLQLARTHLSLLQNGTDAGDVALAEADIREIESRIRQMRETLEKYEIRASRGGVIININYYQGSMVNTGYNIADISADSEKFVVAYVPEKYAGEIVYGQSISVRSAKGETRGVVRYIDVKSQYTPKDMQTSATRNKASVKVKLLLPDDTALIPGNKVEVVIGKLKGP